MWAYGCPIWSQSETVKGRKLKIRITVNVIQSKLSSDTAVPNRVQRLCSLSNTHYMNNDINPVCIAFRLVLRIIFIKK